MTKKRTDGSTAHNMNELVLEGTQGKDGSSIKSSKDESKALTSSEDMKELSKTSGENNLDSIEHLGGSEKLIEHNTRTDSSKSEEGDAKTDDPKTMVREKVIPLLNLGTQLQQRYSIFSFCFSNFNIRSLFLMHVSYS